MSAETLKDLKKPLLMDLACRDLGSHVVVVTNTMAFQEKVKTALGTTRFHALAHLVEYYDQRTQHGFFEQDRAPFMKRHEYAYQREWRIVLKRIPALPGPYRLEVGDIRDITKLTTTEEFNDLLELTLPDGSRA